MKTNEMEIKTLDYKNAIKDSFLKLTVQTQIKNPVMFVVYLGCIMASIICCWSYFTNQLSSFDIQICVWLWFTILFANFAEAIAERKGKAQADTLKKSRTDLIAKVVSESGTSNLAAESLKKGMIILCEVGDVIPADGEVVEGIASVDESAITGESAPVIREAGGDRSGVMAGTKVVSDYLKISVSCEKGESYLDKMVSLIEGAKRRKTPNEIALNILLCFLTLLFIICVFTLKFFVVYIKGGTFSIDSTELLIYISLLVCLAPTTIGALLSAIGISGMERLLRRNVLAKSGKAVETAGDINILLLDKTGTITYGARMAYEIIPAPSVAIDDLARATFLASLEDQTPEGKSIIQYLYHKFQVTKYNIPKESVRFTPFTAETRMSGADLIDEDGKVFSYIRKGSTEAIKQYVLALNGFFPNEVEETSRSIAQMGGTPLVVSIDKEVLGVIYLKDIVKTGIKERFEDLRKMGISTVMVTGDNPLTAATIAAEAGVDDFIAQATPEAKLKRILKEQNEGKLVGMIGDGTNDAPALAQADVGIAMNSGTQAAKEAGNMVDLDSDPTKLLDVVETGKELLMTRGALTTFSIANDISKYFTILPAVLTGVLVVNNHDLGTYLNILNLATPQSAILSTVIFNAIVIVTLIPIALKGVGRVKRSAQSLLTRNVLVYGIGGMITPFIAIKIIDKIITFFSLI
ncbi:MAG: potassium-transporting ATPase subunit B [Bdellovibrionales bacterium RIFOXYA1_FULL_36_14]|nr:MAG: potassium-transporting ATPase subunit B [Bdellovibrionales bacterium RIFOXYA1_FULL_36_14]